jgi:hypothetical protein
MAQVAENDKASRQNLGWHARLMCRNNQVLDTAQSVIPTGGPPLFVSHNHSVCMSKESSAVQYVVCLVRSSERRRFTGI